MHPRVSIKEGLGPRKYQSSHKLTKVITMEPLLRGDSESVDLLREECSTLSLIVPTMEEHGATIRM